MSKCESASDQEDTKDNFMKSTNLAKKMTMRVKRTRNNVKNIKNINKKLEKRLSSVDDTAEMQMAKSDTGLENKNTNDQLGRSALRTET